MLREHIIEIVMLNNKQMFYIYTPQGVETINVEKEILLANKFLDSPEDKKFIYNIYGRTPETLLHYTCTKNSWTFEEFQPDGTIIC